MEYNNNLPQTDEEEDGGEYDGDDVGDVRLGVDQDTGAGSEVVVLVSRGTECPGVWSTVTGAGGWAPAAPPGQTLGPLVLVVTQTGAGGKVEVLQPCHTPGLLLSPTVTVTLTTSLHLHLPTQGLVLPRPPPGHRHHDLHQDILVRRSPTWPGHTCILMVSTLSGLQVK